MAADAGFYSPSVNAPGRYRRGVNDTINGSIHKPDHRLDAD